MSYKINIEDIQHSTKNFKIDFYYFTLKGEADVVAQELYKAILEIKRFNKNPFHEAIRCFNTEEKNNLLNIPVSKDDVSVDEDGLTENHRAYIHLLIKKKGLPSIEDDQNIFATKIANNEAEANLKLFSHLIKKSIENKTMTLEPLVDNFKEAIEENRIPAIMSSIFTEIVETSDGNLNQIINILFDYVQQNVLEVYNSVIESMIGFLEPFK